MYDVNKCIQLYSFDHSFPVHSFINYLDLHLVQIVVCPEDGGDVFLRNLDDTWQTTRT